MGIKVEIKTLKAGKEENMNAKIILLHQKYLDKQKEVVRQHFSIP